MCVRGPHMVGRASSRSIHAMIASPSRSSPATWLPAPAFISPCPTPSQPPDLEILEIGDLSRDRFRGIFRLTYAGDAHLVLSTKVQANPLSKPTASAPSLGGDDETFAPFSTGSATRGILFAAAPLVVPMQLRLSHVRLRAIIVLVVSKTKGITLVFKNDPLESVQVSSTFDSVAVLAKYLQQEIEGQLKEVFREDLPGIIHRLSQKWLSSHSKSKAKASGSTQPSNPSGTDARQREPASRSAAANGAGASAHASPSAAGSKRSRKKSTSGRKYSTSASQMASSDTTPARKTKGRSSKSAASTHDGRPVPPLPVPVPEASTDPDDLPPDFHIPLSTSFDDIEAYDPTYGLRPDEVRLPKNGQGFKGLKGLKRGMSMGHGGLGGKVGLGGLLDDLRPAEDPHIANGAFDAADQGGMESAVDDDDLETASMQRGESEWAEENGLEDGHDDAPGLGPAFVQRRRRNVGAGDDGDVSDSPRPRGAAGSRMRRSSSSSASESSASSSTASSSSSSSEEPVSRSPLDYISPLQEDDPLTDFTRYGLRPTATSSVGRGSRRGGSALGVSPTQTQGTRRSKLADLRGDGHSEPRRRGSSTNRRRAAAEQGSASPRNRPASVTGVAGVGLSGLGLGSLPGTSGRAGSAVLPRSVSASVMGSNAGSRAGSAPMSRLASATTATTRSSPSGSASASSSSRPAAISRPRIFHTSSLVRPPDPYLYGAEAGEEYDPRYLASSGWTGSVGRSESVGGGSTTIAGGGGGGGRSSRPGSSRTFTIRRKGGVTASTVRSGASERTLGRDDVPNLPRSSVLGGVSRPSAQASARELFARYDSDQREDSYAGVSDVSSGAEGAEEYDDFGGEFARYNANSYPAVPSGDEIEDEMGDEVARLGIGPSSRSTPSIHSGSGTGSGTGGSKTGTLATLEPEPMDENSSAYRRHIYREQYGGQDGLYRPGWGAASTKGSASAGASASASASEREEADAAWDAKKTGGGRPSLAAQGRRGSARSNTTVPAPRHAQAPRDASPMHRLTATPPHLQLKTLASSNQTLSPYTRLGDTRGFAVRSAPGTPGTTTPGAGVGLAGSGLSMGAGDGGAGGTEARDREARRRRTFQLG